MTMSTSSQHVMALCLMKCKQSFVMTLSFCFFHTGFNVRCRTSYALTSSIDDILYIFFITVSKSCVEIKTMVKSEQVQLLWYIDYQSFEFKIHSFTVTRIHWLRCNVSWYFYKTYSIHLATWEKSYIWSLVK